MTDGQRQAAAWLQGEGYAISEAPGGFIAVHPHASMWVIASERKTRAGMSDQYGSTTDEVRKIASVETVRELLNGIARKPRMSPYYASLILKALVDHGTGTNESAALAGDTD